MNPRTNPGANPRANPRANQRGAERNPAQEAERLAAWIAALERTHLANLTISEVARALRALSSCYVERRSRLTEGAALSSNGKRAAFALFYAPMHWLVVREIVNALPAALEEVNTVIDLGCGTGAAGASWAVAAGADNVRGMDRHPWAIREANATYRLFQLSGRAVQQDLSRARLDRSGGLGVGIIAAYAINELSTDGRDFALAELLAAHRRGARVLVVEPIARGLAPWWDDWKAAFVESGGRSDDWRFARGLPPTVEALARAAGLNPRELTARSLWLPPLAKAAR